MVEDEIDVNGIEYDFVNKVVLLKKTQPTKPKIEEKKVELSSENSIEQLKKDRGGGVDKRDVGGAQILLEVKSHNLNMKNISEIYEEPVVEDRPNPKYHPRQKS